MILQVWDDYGIGWDGPVPYISDDDTDTVVVTEIQDILSAEQKANLDDHNSSINPTLSLTESLLVDLFATAKAFIHTCFST